MKRTSLVANLDSERSSKKPKSDGFLETTFKSFTIIPSERCIVNKIPEPIAKGVTVDELLPQPPFLLTIVAPTKSGKTNLLVDLLTDKKKLCKKFDAVFIWSKSFDSDPKWKKVKIDRKYVKKAYDERELKQMIANMEEIYEKTKFNVLLVFDDMIDQKIMNIVRLGACETIAVRGRHFGGSVVIVTQLFNKLSRPIRVNTTNLAVFRIRNNKELKTIMEENQELLTKEQFISLYKMCTDEPYGFLHINARDTDPTTRFRKNWSHIIKLS